MCEGRMRFELPCPSCGHTTEPAVGRLVQAEAARAEKWLDGIRVGDRLDRAESAQLARDVLALVEERGRLLADLDLIVQSRDGREDELEALGRQLRDMHRRAQKAEGELATKPTLHVLTETLEQLKQAKSDRHRLRNDYAFKVRECSRLTSRLKAAEAEAATLRQALQQAADSFEEIQRLLVGKGHPRAYGVALHAQQALAARVVLGEPSEAQSTKSVDVRGGEQR